MYGCSDRQQCLRCPSARANEPQSDVSHELGCQDDTSNKHSEHILQRFLVWCLQELLPGRQDIGPVRSTHPVSSGSRLGHPCMSRLTAACACQHRCLQTPSFLGCCCVSPALLSIPLTVQSLRAPLCGQDVETKHSLSGEPTGRARTAQDHLPACCSRHCKWAQTMLVSGVLTDMSRDRVMKPGVRVLETLLLSSVEKQWTSTRRAE